MSILLVSKSKSFKEFVKDAMEEIDVDTKSACSASEGLSLYKKEPRRYMLVICAEMKNELQIQFQNELLKLQKGDLRLSFLFLNKKDNDVIFSDDEKFQNLVINKLGEFYYNNFFSVSCWLSDRESYSSVKKHTMKKIIHQALGKMASHSEGSLSSYDPVGRQRMIS